MAVQLRLKWLSLRRALVDIIDFVITIAAVIVAVIIIGSDTNAQNRSL